MADFYGNQNAIAFNYTRNIQSSPGPGVVPSYRGKCRIMMDFTIDPIGIVDHVDFGGMDLPGNCLIHEVFVWGYENRALMTARIFVQTDTIADTWTPLHGTAGDIAAAGKLFRIPGLVNADSVAFPWVVNPTVYPNWGGTVRVLIAGAASLAGDQISVLVHYTE